MINKNKKNKAIENNDIFIYFSIALVTVVLMLIAPMLNKSIYAKSSTLPANFEKGKATTNAITEESGQALQDYMKTYEDSQTLVSSYYNENARYLHNKNIEPAYEEKNQIDGYNGPIIDNHKNFLPEGYFWDESGKAMREKLGQNGEKDVSNVNFAADLLNPYAGILCFYEGKRLPSGSQISKEMFLDGMNNTTAVPGGKLVKDHIFQDEKVIEDMVKSTNERKDGGNRTEKRTVTANVTQPDYKLWGGATNFFAGEGASYKTALFGRREGLRVGSERGLGLQTPVVKADANTVNSAINNKANDDMNALNDVLNGNTRVQRGNEFARKSWSSIYTDPNQADKYGIENGTHFLITNKKSTKHDTDDEHDGNYEDITGGHKLSVEKIIAKDGSFPAMMAQQNTRIWGANNYSVGVKSQTKKPGEHGVDSHQGAAWQTNEADHVLHPDPGTTPEGNKAKADARAQNNPEEASRLKKFVKEYQEYERLLKEWISQNPADISLESDGKTAKVINHPKEPQLRYILPVGYHTDKEVPNSGGQKAPNPKLQYQPKIEPGGTGKSLKDVSKVKFDKKTQKWLIGPYKLKYFQNKLKNKVDKTAEDSAKAEGTIKQPEGAMNYLPQGTTRKPGTNPSTNPGGNTEEGSNDKDRGKLTASITEVELYGIYESDIKTPQKTNPNKSDLKTGNPKDNVDQDRFGTKQDDDSKYTFVKSWQFLTKKGELSKTEFPNDGEEFYFAINYDPALHKIVKARFVFGYMIQGTEYTKVVGTYNKTTIGKKNGNDKGSNPSTNGGGNPSTNSGNSSNGKSNSNTNSGKSGNSSNGGKTSNSGKSGNGKSNPNTNSGKSGNSSNGGKTSNSGKSGNGKSNSNTNSGKSGSSSNGGSTNKKKTKVNSSNTLTADQMRARMNLKREQESERFRTPSTWGDFRRLDNEELKKAKEKEKQNNDKYKRWAENERKRVYWNYDYRTRGNSSNNNGKSDAAKQDARIKAAQDWAKSRGRAASGYYYASSTTGSNGPVKSVKVGNGNLATTEKYDFNGQNTGHVSTTTNGPIFNTGINPIDQLRNILPLNGNMPGMYSIGGVGSVTTGTTTIPTPGTAGIGGHNELNGARITNETPNEESVIEYETEYNIKMQTITIMEKGAARWGEEIALELYFDSDDTITPPSNPPSTPSNPPVTKPQLRLPIGGTVWEDNIPDDKKHTGYNNVFDRDKEKGIAGVRVRIHRNFVELNENKSIKRIIRKEIARVYKRETGELLDQTKDPIISDENGKWGGYDIHDVGFNRRELEEMGGSAKDNYAILFDVTFDFDGIMYEPVKPLQTLEGSKTELFKDGQSFYNSTTTEEKAKYKDSSFAIEHFGDREEYNRKHAEITGGKENDSSLKTDGIAQGVDEQGNRVETKTALEYTGEKTTEGPTTQRFKSNYQMKKTNGRTIDDKYFNDFIEASTLFVGINLPTNEQIVYDNPGTNAGENKGTNPNTNNGGNKGTNPGTNSGENKGTNPSSNPSSSNELLDKKNAEKNSFNGLFDFLNLGKNGKGVTNPLTNDDSLWNRIQKVGSSASKVLDQIIGYGKLTGAILGELVDKGALKKNPLEKVLTKVDKATAMLKSLLQDGLVTSDAIQQAVKNGGSKSEAIMKVIKSTTIGNKLSQWIERKIGVKVAITDDRIPTDLSDNATGEEILNRILKDPNANVKYENGIGIDTTRAQKEQGLTEEQALQKAREALGFNVYSKAVDQVNNGNVNLDEVLKGQSGKYAGSILSQIANNGKLDSTNLEKIIKEGAESTEIIDQLAKNHGISTNISGLNINLNGDLKDMLNQILQQSGVAGTAIGDLVNNGKVDMKKIWEQIQKDGGIDLGIWEDIIKSGKIDNQIWDALGENRGEDQSKPNDQQIDQAYQAYAGTYYSQRSYMNDINLGLKRRSVDMEVTKDLNSALVIANRKAYNYLYKSLYDEYLTENEKKQGLGRTVEVDMENIQKGRDAHKTQRFLDIYKTDYIYRTSMYSSDENVKKLLEREIAEERAMDKTDTAGNHKDTRQVDVFLTYKINVVNSSPIDAVYVSQLNDIHSDKMEIVQQEIKKEIQQDPTTNIEKQGVKLEEEKQAGKPNTTAEIPVSKYIIHDKNTDIANLSLSEVDQSKMKELKWDAQGKGDRIPAQDNGYTATQTEGDVNTAGFTLKPGERADIFNTYRVKNALNVEEVKNKDGESLGELKDKVGKEDGIKTLANALELGDFTNVAEIGAFAAYNVHTGTYSGKIDRDSAPSNFTTKKQGGKFVLEDDTDDAPGINVRIPRAEQNPEKVSRELTGTIWEDKQNTLNRGIMTGDGKKDENEKGIAGQPVTLEERLSFRGEQIDGHENFRYAEVPNGKAYFDLGFVWPENIKADDIEMNLKGVTGFESNVKTDDKGQYKFTGVPAGNFVVSLNYSTPNEQKLKEVYAKTNAKGIANAVSEADIDANDLVPTVKDGNNERKVKWYNGETFKTTQFYADGKQEANLNTTWLAKNKDEDKETQILSYARDDEGRRIEVTRNLDTFKNSVIDALNVFKEADKGKIDVEKLKLAHKYTSMNATTPKINFSIEYYEKLEKQKAGSAVILNELKNIYYVEGIYKGKNDTKLENVDYSVKNINMGIVQRPESKIVLNKEINNVVITTADGTEKINLKYNVKSKISKADKGKLSNNVYGGTEDLFARLEVERELDKENSTGEDLVLSLDRTKLTDGKEEDKAKRENAKAGFRYINIDESVMQDATIKIRYGIYAYNLSQLDRTINVDDENVKNTNIYREEAYKTGIDDEEEREDGSTTLGRLQHQSRSKYQYGKYVGQEYYINKGETPLTPEEEAKINIRAIMDIVDNGATVNMGDEENMQWVAANKEDLVGLVNGVKNEEKAKEADYVDESGIRYIEEVSDKDKKEDKSKQGNSNTRSNILLLKESTTDMNPINPYEDVTREYKNVNGYALSPETDNFVRTWKLRTDRTSSGSSTSNDLTFQNMAEVIAYHTSNGRRTEFTPGVLITEMDKKNQTGDGTLPGKGEAKEGEADKENNLDRAYMVAAESTGTAATEIVTLSPPTGLGQGRLLDMLRKNALLILSVVAVLVTGTVMVVMYNKRKKKS